MSEKTQNNGWISVKEELPHEGQLVIVVNKLGSVGTGYFYDLVEKSLWLFQQEEITHWQPLPPPPVKKRWMPKDGEPFFTIDNHGAIHHEFYDGEPLFIRNFLGIYRMYKEADSMLDKIKALVTENIGEP